MPHHRSYEKNFIVDNNFRYFINEQNKADEIFDFFKNIEVGNKKILQCLFDAIMTLINMDDSNFCGF
jgi:hypothetical protein